MVWISSVASLTLEVPPHIILKVATAWCRLLKLSSKTIVHSRDAFPCHVPESRESDDVKGK